MKIGYYQLKYLISISVFTLLIASTTFFSALLAAADKATESEVKKQNYIIINNLVEPSSLDPHKFSDAYGGRIVKDLLEGLMIVSPEGTVIKGQGAAQDFSVNQTFTEWRFELRRNGKWSNGDPVTAHDFVYAFQRLADPAIASPFASILQESHMLNAPEIIKGEKKIAELGVKAVDDYTLLIALAKPLSYFDKMLTHAAFLPLHRATVEKWGNAWTQPGKFIGNAAYKLTQWVVNERIEVTRNPFYWNNQKTQIEKAIFLGVNTPLNILQRYRNDELTLTEVSPATPDETMRQLMVNYSKEIIKSPTLGTRYYVINLQRKALQTADVRAALKWAFDTETLGKIIFKHGFIPAYGFTPPYTDGIAFKKPEWAKWSREKRNEAAQKALLNAGYSKKKPLQLTILAAESSTIKKQLEATRAFWKQNLKDMVTIKVNTMEWKAYLDALEQGNFDIATTGWSGAYNEPAYFLNILLSNSSANHMHYINTEFDRLMKESSEMQDNSARAQLYQRAEKIIDADTPIIPILHTEQLILAKPNLKGIVATNPLDITKIHTKDLYFTED